jgi:ketosteroid isomerase-like protein
MSDPAHAISNLVHRYAELIDLGDFDGVGELFANAVITTDLNDEVREGAAAAAEQFKDWTRRYPDGTPRTKHVTTNLIIEVAPDGRTATCRSYFMVFQQTDELSLQPIIGGRYHDELTVVDGEWSFTRRHYMSDLFGDLSAHLLRPVE